MTHIRMTSHFDAPIEQVFALATDYKRYPEWNASYAEVREVVGPPDQVGTRIHAVMKLLGRSMEGWAEIVEVEKPRLLKVRGTGDQGGSATLIYTLTPVAGGTDLTFESDYELPAGLLGQIADKLFVERAVERDLRHSAENFKALVEAPVPALA